VSTTGESATTAVAVGAHQAHLRDGVIRLAVGCPSCHVVPTSTAHADGTVDLAWSALAGSVTWDGAARTCATYCHGATLGAGGTNTRPFWTSVGTGQTACGTCHGSPPPPPHPASTACAGCHPATVRADGAIDVAGGQHIDGTLDASVSCGSCHGVPPALGAHLAHAAFPDPSVTGYGDLRILEDYAPGGGPAYLFGCGHCHPLDPARHMDAVVQVDLSPAAAGATGLRTLNAAGAAYAGGACSGVYCHSSGQETPAYVATPAWTAAPGALGCDGCHGNPPQYLSGGPGAATANSHLNLAEDGYEFGHFLGMPGPTHTSRHGNRVWGLEDDAAPITCQTCHYETTDPSGAGPSGFYWLDTTGSYALPGGAAGRDAWLAEQQCGYCHNSGGAPTGVGKVLPLRHVNGSRDVVFDPRDALPAIAWLPAAPNTPTAPYWMTRAHDYEAYPAWVTWNGATVSFGVATATYDAATKRCGNVACHLAEQPVWGTPYVYTGSVTCVGCHPRFAR
jgi:predicted CxxxxCH...CXXCH cytochrome family protein